CFRPEPRWLGGHGGPGAWLARGGPVALLLPLPLRTEEAVLLPPQLTVKILASAGIVVAGALGVRAAMRANARATFAVIAITTTVMLGYEAWTLAPRYNARCAVRGFARRVTRHVAPAT